MGSNYASVYTPKDNFAEHQLKIDGLDFGMQPYLVGQSIDAPEGRWPLHDGNVAIIKNGRLIDIVQE